MTVFLIFVFFGLFFLLLCSVFGLWLLVSDRSRLIEIGICVGNLDNSGTYDSSGLALMAAADPELRGG